MWSLKLGSPLRWMGRAKQRGVGIVNIVKQRETVGIENSAEVGFEGKIHELVRRDGGAFSQTDRDSELATNNLSALLRRVSGTSTIEIDNLITELRILRDKLQADGNRVERDIVEYAALSQSVVDMTRIITDSMIQVKKMPKAPTISDLG